MTVKTYDALISDIDTSGSGGTTGQEMRNIVESIRTTGPWGSVTQYGAVGNGSSDDHTAFQSAINAAQGRPIYMPAGSYSMNNKTLIPPSEGAFLIGEGKQTVLLYGASNELFNNSTTSTYGSSTNVTSIATVNNYPSTNSERAYRITCNASGIDRGDIVLIYSNQTLSNTNNGFRAELVRVLDVDGSNNWFVVVALRTIFNTSSFTVRARVMNRSHNILLKDFTVKGDGNVFSTGVSNRSAAGAVVVQGCYQPVIDGVHFEETWRAGLTVRGCWQADVDVSYFNLPDQGPQNAYGYGCVLMGCNKGTRVKIIGDRCRHTFDTNIYNNSNFSDGLHARYGIAIETHVHDSIGYSTNAATWDTHEFFDLTFDNCIAIGAHPDALSDINNQAFQLRGYSVRITNCKTRECGSLAWDPAIRYDFSMMRDMDSVMVLLEGCQFEGSNYNDSVNSCTGWRVAGSSSSQGRGVSIIFRNCTFRRLEFVLDNDDADAGYEFVRFENCLIIDPINSTSQIKVGSNNDLWWVNSHMHFIDAEGSGMSVVETGDVGTSNVYCSGGFINGGGSGQPSSFIRGTGGTTNLYGYNTISCDRSLPAFTGSGSLNHSFLATGPMISGSGSPTSSAHSVGEEYLDTSANRWYKSVSVGSGSSDWRALN